MIDTDVIVIALLAAPAIIAILGFVVVEIIEALRSRPEDGSRERGR